MLLESRMAISAVDFAFLENSRKGGKTDFESRFSTPKYLQKGFKAEDSLKMTGISYHCMIPLHWPIHHSCEILQPIFVGFKSRDDIV